MSEQSPTFDEHITKEAQEIKFKEKLNLLAESLNDFAPPGDRRGAESNAHLINSIALTREKICEFKERIATLEADALVAADKLAAAEKRLETAAARIQTLENALRTCRAAITACKDDLTNLPKITDHERCNQM